MTILAFSLVVVGFLEANTENSITASFTEAHNPEKVYVEEIYWDFGGNKTATGEVAMEEFPKGTHNVTVRVEKSNGELEIHRGEVKIE